MATLSDLVEMILVWQRRRYPDASFGEQCAREMEAMIRRSLAGERVYVPAPDTSKKADIANAARTLPTGVVAERFGVTQSYVRKLVRRK